MKFVWIGPIDLLPVEDMFQPSFWQKLYTEDQRF